MRQNPVTDGFAELYLIYYWQGSHDDQRHLECKFHSKHS
jgi:hypothetical protein